MEFVITKHVADLSEKTKGGWVKQINFVKWGNNKEKLEIRLWHYPEGENTPDRAGRGITLTKEEYDALCKIPNIFETIDMIASD